MSYSNLKSLVIKDNKVIVRSCCNNVFPKTYDSYVNEHLTKILNEEGKNKVLEALTIDILNGCIKITGNTKVLNELKEGAEKIRSSSGYIEIINRQHFLEGKIFTKERKKYINEYRSLNKEIEKIVSNYYK